MDGQDPGGDIEIRFFARLGLPDAGEEQVGDSVRRRDDDGPGAPLVADDSRGPVEARPVPETASSELHDLHRRIPSARASSALRTQPPAAPLMVL